MKRKKWSVIVWQAIRKEMRLECLGLDYERPSRFCKSQWHCPSSACCKTAYVAFRWLVAIYLVTGLLLNWVDPREELKVLKWPANLIFRAKWFIYITNWALFVLTLQAVMAAILATNYHFSQDLLPEDASMSKFHKAYWLLNNLANTSAPTITLLFWTTVYDKKKHFFDFGNVHNHIMNSVLTVADLMVTAHPVRLLHFVHPMALAVIYALFSFLYFHAGGTSRTCITSKSCNTMNKGSCSTMSQSCITSQCCSTSIYPYLNWGNPHVAIIYITGTCILLVMVHTLIWLFYQLRRTVALQLGTLRPSDASPFTTTTTSGKMNSVLPIDIE